jgi:hypothetical protein
MTAECALRSGRLRNWIKLKIPNSPAMLRARETEW